jgi:hypothetical protein
MGWGRGLINACWEEWRFGGRLLKSLRKNGHERRVLPSGELITR